MTAGLLRSARVLACTGAVLLLEACATVGKVSVTPISDERFTARAGDAAVTVYENVPARPHTILAVMIVEGGGVLYNRNDMVDRMKTEARGLGGDAIVALDCAMVGPRGKYTCQGQVARWTESK